MTTALEARREQARRELGRTDIGRTAAGMLVGALCLTLLLVPVVEEVVRLRTPDAEPLALVALPRAFASAVQEVGADGPIAADLGLLEALDRIEGRLEDESFLRVVLLPRVRGLLFRSLGLGTEEVYNGRDGWLFLRSDVDHVTGPGFLEPAWLRARARGGDVWKEAPVPDPRPALRSLESSLDARGIALIVMPTPVKPTVHPGEFSKRRLEHEAGYRNRSYSDLVEELETDGLEFFDPAIHGTEYLRTDTHWTPDAVNRVAAALAERVGSHLGGNGDRRFYERPTEVEGLGDLALRLGVAPARAGIETERATTHMVLDEGGSLWRPTRGAPVLLLGDSFTNVFSDPRLGWGSGAGLAERLSFHSGRPVDRIAINAGGSHAAREALARELAADPGRLDGVRIVVYQFATRELSFGDWKAVDLGPTGVPAGPQNGI